MSKIVFWAKLDTLYELFSFFNLKGNQLTMILLIDINYCHGFSRHPLHEQLFHIVNKVDPDQP